MNALWHIIRFQVNDTLRSKWLVIYSLFYVVLSYGLLSFTNDSSKVILSLLNINMIVIPLASLLFGTIYLYNNRDYIILILSQPINRKTLYFGLYLGLALPMALSFAIGTGVPVLIYLRNFQDTTAVLFNLFLGGVFETFIFVSISFLIATINENKMKGLGIAIFVWLFFSALYDGLILITLQVFREYPLEVPSIIFTLLNPVDLSRLLVILKFDISALMGYTGAVFNKFLGSGLGFIISLLSLVVWSVFPILLGLRSFTKKDF